MFKKIITTIPATSDAGMLCADCPLKGQGMNQMQFCSFYKKSHDSNKPAFCNVELIEVTEDIGQGPTPTYYDRDMNPVPPPEISTLDIHDFCHDLHNDYGINWGIHVQVETRIADWLERKGIKVKK